MIIEPKRATSGTFAHRQAYCLLTFAVLADASAFHFCGWLENKLVAYCRLLPPGISYPGMASIGRVVTDPAHRNDGLGKIMMSKAILKTYELFDVSGIKIGAQQYLTKFYEDLGFVISSEPYLEDGIPHLEMILSK